MAWCALLCLPLQQATVLAVCPFCEDREVWKERYCVSVASFSVLLLNFLTELKFVVHGAWFCSASKTGTGESTSVEPRDVLSGHELEIPGLAFVKKHVLKQGRYKASLSF